jgi:hypothetical protein
MISTPTIAVLVSIYEPFTFFKRDLINAGVLTKPDRLSSGERGHVWKKVLEGRAFVKGHGYFVVKQPDQAELDSGVSHAQARVQEQEYFDSLNWTTRFPGFVDRLGTRKLQSALADKLAALILHR